MTVSSTFWLILYFKSTLFVVNIAITRSFVLWSLLTSTYFIDVATIVSQKVLPESEIRLGPF